MATTSRTAATNRKSLELLYDYTKFHIGVYLTLTASFITVASVKVNDSQLLTLNWPLVAVAVVAFMLAGLAGGIIVSSITQTDSTSSAKFLDEKIGPWDWELLHFLSARCWTHIEHTSFWIGLIVEVRYRFGRICTPSTEARTTHRNPRRAPSPGAVAHFAWQSQLHLHVVWDSEGFQRPTPHQAPA